MNEDEDVKLRRIALGSGNYSYVLSIGEREYINPSFGLLNRTLNKHKKQLKVID